ncbi:hypothetical protein FG379_001772 [Cryptosporidium bovis]|uniref:uncharacterized protein n=1 Tax=Cryptosporidium bovis TaxID=310047 RepID=UPI00351A2748|nr:hypothetical protein FG379_001772 [Cryptosporidium bovis]
MQNETILCTVCGFIIKDKTLLKEHYKADWHIYNQKRKLANKEPVTEEVFKRKLELLNTTKCIVEKGNSHIKCKNQTDYPITNKKCDKQVKIIQELPYKPTYCYFDNTIHNTMQECLEYMRIKYSFIIPDKEYVSDFQGLVIYLGEKVFEGHICLYCDKIFSSLMAVRDHMITLGHTMMGTHLEIQKEEIEQFYNYSSSYKELIPCFRKMSINSEQNIQSLLENNKNSSRVKDESKNNVEDEWEYIDEDVDGFFIDDILSAYNLKKPEITEFGDLRLPNGKEVVHRNMAYIYRQKIHRDDNYQLSLKKSEAINKKVNILSNNNSNINLPGVKYLNKVHMKQNFLLSNKIKTNKLKTGVNNNKLQKFFVRQDIIW